MNFLKWIFIIFLLKRITIYINNIKIIINNNDNWYIIIELKDFKFDFKYFGDENFVFIIKLDNCQLSIDPDKTNSTLYIDNIDL